MESASKRLIPFEDSVRLGNYNLWRSKKLDSVGSEIEVINISGLDDGWQVTIPETFAMFAVITELYADMGDDDDDECRNGLIFILDNMQYATIIPNGHYHRAIRLITMAYVNPSILKKRDKDYKPFMKDVKELVSDFLDWSEANYNQELLNAPTEDEMDDDELADTVTEYLDMLQKRNKNLSN